MAERETDALKAWKEIPSFLKMIPFEACRYERLPLTNEWAWKAPEGKAFRVSGHFIIDSDQNDISFRNMPHKSREMLKDENPEKLRCFLKDTDGDEEAALELLTKDLYDFLYTFSPPKFFDGIWLVITPGLKDAPRTKNPEDFYSDEIMVPSSLEPPQVKIKEDVVAWSERDRLGIIEDINPKSPTVTAIAFDSQDPAVYWIQYFATVVFGKSGINLVDCPEKTKKLYIPKPENRKSLHLPDGVSNNPAEESFSVRMSDRVNRRRERVRS